MKFWQKLSSALRNKKIILWVLAVAVVFAGGLIPFHEAKADAGIISWIAEKAVIMTANGVVYILNKIGSALYVFFAGLIDLALQVNALILSSPIVLKGWGIVLSFANLGFVLAIIIIAFATIFRMQSYAMKQVLWKLIVAALLVNFSLVIAGAFINVADSVTKTFNDKLGATLSNGLTQILQPQALIATKDETAKMSFAEKYSRSVLKTIAGLNRTVYWATGLDAGDPEKYLWGDNKEITSKGALELLVMLFFPAIFTLLSALTLLAVAIMMFIRYFVLGVLLILSPIVWLLWIFPGTSNLWQKWWNNFLRWTFFAPIMMFFLYLAISSTGGDLQDKRIQESVEKSQEFSIKLAEKQQGLPVDITIFGNAAIVIGLIMSGLIAANSLGIYGSKLAMGIAKGAGKWAGGAVGGIAERGAKGIGKRILTSGAKKDAVTGEVTTRGQRFAAKLSGIPVLRGVASKISNITSSKARKEEVEKYAKDNLANLSNDAIVNQANAKMAFLNPVKASALGQELAKRNLTDRIDPALVKKYISTATKLGAEEPILNNRPDLSDDKLKTMSKIKAGKADEIHHKAFEDVDIVVSLDNSKLERLSKEGSTQQKDTIVNSIKTTLGSALAPIETVRDYIEKTKKGITDAQATGDTALTTALIFERDRLIADEKTLISGLGAREQKLLKHHDFISNNVNWQV